MEFLRRVVNSDTLSGVVELPPSFCNREVEVIILPIASHEAPVQPIKHSAFGRLKAYANPSRIKEEAGAWEEAVAEKYVLY